MPTQTTTSLLDSALPIQWQILIAGLVCSHKISHFQESELRYIVKVGISETKPSHRNKIWVIIIHANVATKLHNKMVEFDNKESKCNYVCRGNYQHLKFYLPIPIKSQAQTQCHFRVLKLMRLCLNNWEEEDSNPWCWPFLIASKLQNFN